MAKSHNRPQEPAGPLLDLEPALEPYVAKVGRGRTQLEWAIRLAQESPTTMTPADWENRRREIAAFCALAGSRWVPAVGETFTSPDETETREIQKLLGELILKVIRRDRDVSFGVALTESGIVWRETSGRYVTWQIVRHATPPRNIGGLWRHDAVTALGRLLAEYGHLVKECPAPAPRGEEGKTCGTWFVANRPRQAYCSARCQSRDTTRAYRKRVVAPPSARGQRFRRKSRRQRKG